MDDQNFKVLPPKKFNFPEILKIHDFFPKSANFCLFLFYYLYIEKMFTVEMEDVRAAPWKPSYYMFYLIVDLGTAKVLLEHWQVSCHLPTHSEILETSGIGIDLQFMRLTFYKSFNKIYDKFLFIHLYFVCLLCIQSTSKLTNRLFSGGGGIFIPAFKLLVMNKKNSRGTSSSITPQTLNGIVLCVFYSLLLLLNLRRIKSCSFVRNYLYNDFKCTFRIFY